MRQSTGRPNAGLFFGYRGVLLSRVMNNVTMSPEETAQLLKKLTKVQKQYKYLQLASILFLVIITAALFLIDRKPFKQAIGGYLAWGLTILLFDLVAVPALRRPKIRLALAKKGDITVEQASGLVVKEKSTIRGRRVYSVGGINLPTTAVGPLRQYVGQEVSVSYYPGLKLMRDIKPTNGAQYNFT